FSVVFRLLPLVPTHLYTLSLHDALPILWRRRSHQSSRGETLKHPVGIGRCFGDGLAHVPMFDDLAAFKPEDFHDREPQFFGLKRSEEHTSELQSPDHLVCRLLLEKKKK